MVSVERVVTGAAVIQGRINDVVRHLDENPVSRIKRALFTVRTLDDSQELFTVVGLGRFEHLAATSEREWLSIKRWLQRRYDRVERELIDARIFIHSDEGRSLKTVHDFGREATHITHVSEAELLKRWDNARKEVLRCVAEREAIVELQRFVDLALNLVRKKRASTVGVIPRGHATIYEKGSLQFAEGDNVSFNVADGSFKVSVLAVDIVFAQGSFRLSPRPSACRECAEGRNIPNPSKVGDVYGHHIF